jgi:hypothetical protein
VAVRLTAKAAATALLTDVRALDRNRSFGTSGRSPLCLDAYQVS